MAITVISLKLQAEKPIVFGSFSGFSVRGLFYELVRRVDVEYAESLHSSKRLASFSTSPIIRLSPGGSEIVYKALPQGVQCIVRFVVLDDRLAQKVLNSLLVEKSMKLMDVEVRPVEVSVFQREYAEFLEESQPVEVMSVRFLTPTFFRFSPLIASGLFPSKRPAGGAGKLKLKNGRRFHPIPEPILMMRSLTRLWRAFSNKPFNYSDYLSWVSSMGVSLAGYPKGIRTMRLYEHFQTKKFIVGFVGTVNFSIPKDLYIRKWAKITDALLRFAEYSNVGGGRTAGFGMVKYIPKKYSV